MARLTLVALAAVMLLGGALGDDWGSGGEELSGTVKLKEQAGMRVILNPSKPKLTVLSTAAACPDGSNSDDCLGQFIMTAIKDVYEVDVTGAKVEHRGAGDVLDFSEGKWEVAEKEDLSAVTTPPLNVSTATFTVPFRDAASIDACEPAAPFPAPAADTQQFVFKVLLFPNDTTFTPEGQEPVEVLKGNVKTTLAVTGWPFCDASSQLVVQLALKSTKLGADDAPRTVSTQTGEEAEQEILELTEDVLSAVGAQLEDEEDDSVQVSSIISRRLLDKDNGAGAGGKGKGNSGNGSGSANTTTDSGSDSVSGSQSASGNGGSSGKRKISRSDAVAELPTKKELPAATRAALENKVAKRRPVAGLGRPGHTGRLFLALPGAGAVDSKVDVPTVALVDGISFNITANAPAFTKGQGVQRVLLTFPSFTTLEWDPTTAFSQADSTLNQGIEEALGVGNGAAPAGGRAGGWCLVATAAVGLLLL